MIKINYKGVEINVEQEDDDYCFSFEINNKLFLGQFKTLDKTVETAKKDIDEELK